MQGLHEVQAETKHSVVQAMLQSCEVTCVGSVHRLCSTGLDTEINYNQVISLPLFDIAKHA